MTREELWLAAIAGLEGAVPPDYPVWHYEQMLAAIYDAVTGAADPRPFPERSWHLDEFLYAVYCAVAGLDDPGCPAPTCRIEEFWKGIHDAATGDDSASVPDPVWRIEEFLSGIFDVAGELGGGVNLTVTGNAPLTLSNALDHAIRSLTQTGLCTQASTPTQSSPVPIKCNNGTLTVVDDELPSGYKRVKGFSMNGNCYWGFTDFKLQGSDTLRFSFSCTAACNVIGAYSGSASGNNYSLYTTTGNGNYLRYNGGAYNSGIDADTRYDVVITPTGTTGMKTDSTWTALEFTTSTDFCVGTTSTSTSSAKMKGSFFGDIIVDGRLHLVPCERLSDNVLGYYDLVGEAFYAPTTGTPTSIGYDGSHYVSQTVGTPEVITVGMQTASVVDLLSLGDYADTQDVISGIVTRKVGMKVLNGTETYFAYLNGVYALNYPSFNEPDLMCSHFSNSGTYRIDAVTLSDGKYRAVFHVDVTDYPTVSSFEDWIKEQYDAGTPVVILYVLPYESVDGVGEQPMNTAEGTNTVSVTAEVSPIALSCIYKGARE